MKRTIEQSALIHVFFREISEFLTAGGVPCSEKMVKALCCATLGNNTEFLGTKISMPTSSYPRADEDLTPAQHANGTISMETFIQKIVTWAATDINLELKSINEESIKFAS